MASRTRESHPTQLVLRALLLLAAALVVLASPGRALADSKCRSVQSPVRIADVPRATLYGELCLPSGQTPKAVQLLVHGGTYNHYYWDYPLNPDLYSYVRRAVDAGYATFNIDRLGTGQSTHPASPQVTLENGAEALHQVIGKLRDGSIGPGFRQVVWVGHSLGSITAWIEAYAHSDVDAFVLTGITHAADPSIAGTLTDAFYPAIEDPKFADSGLDSGYLTTRPGLRGALFYYPPGADPDVIALDEQLKDTVTTAELGEAFQLITLPPPESAPSQSITVPTLLMLGEHDTLVCAPPDGSACTEEYVLSTETPYYTAAASLEANVVPDAGHDLQLHLNSPESTTQILDWITQTLG